MRFLWLVFAFALRLSALAEWEIERSIRYLEREVSSWQNQNNCFSCHNNGDGSRALFRAKAKGFRVDGTALAETKNWLVDPGSWKENKGDPGFSDKQLANIQFAAALNELDAVEPNPKALENARSILRKGQTQGGFWRIEGEIAAGSPAAYGTVLATVMAMNVLEVGSPEGKRAINWLKTVPLDTTVNAASVLLAKASIEDEDVDEKRSAALKHLFRSQSPSGGWGPYPKSPSEVFDTALAILALTQVRGEEEAKRVEEGRQWLLREQRADGSWAATTRPSGSDSYAQQISTTAWALMALLESAREKSAGAPLRE